MKFNTSLTYKPNNDGYKSKKPSMTIPGQTYSLPQIINRLRSGLPVQAIKAGYNPDGFPMYDDLTDIDQFKNAIKQKLNAINEKIEAIKAKKEAASEAKATTE